jgi:alpha 1,2-mannosyltransferase
MTVHDRFRLFFRPDVHFHCDVHYDPFLFMQDNNKIYGKPVPNFSTPPSPAFAGRESYLTFIFVSAGFTITMYEYERTIQTMWKTIQGAVCVTDCSGRLKREFQIS